MMASPEYPEIEDWLNKLDLPSGYKSGVQHTILMMRPLLHYMPRGIPEYTDHGVLHSQNLMTLLCGFVQNWAGEPFTNEERYLLSLAVWLHDVGCLLGRERHNEKSVNLLRHPRFSYIDSLLSGDLQSCLKYIIISHVTDYDLKEVPKKPIHEKVRLRLVCATFRLVDGCDITDARTKPVLYDILKTYSLLEEGSIKYWESHLSTIGTVFQGNAIYVTYRKGKRKESEMLVSHLKKDLRRLNRVFEKYGMSFRIKLHSSEY